MRAILALVVLLAAGMAQALPGVLIVQEKLAIQRLGDPKRAFSDIAEAKRIEALNRNKPPSVARAPQR